MQAQATNQHISTLTSAFRIGGERFETKSRGFAEAAAAAHAAHLRPRCMCLVEGVEMYVARLGDGFIVKRMPNTGSHHAPDCPSYEPLAELSGLGQVLGSAIAEDPATGETTLKLDFPLTRFAGRSPTPANGDRNRSVTAAGAKMSLRGLLHYLWDQAELTRWQPGFAGKRSWATVRKHLLQAAENKIARGGTLRARLYIPEMFTVDRREVLNARRTTQWLHAMAAPGRTQQLMLIIAEVKEIVQARYGYKAIIKHLPDQPFAVDAQLYRRLGRQFERELSLWGSTDDLHMVMMGTFGLDNAGIPAIADLTLMPVTAQWLPVEDAYEKRLVEQLIHDGRAFIKGLRYNLPAEQTAVCSTLVDVNPGPVALSIAHNNIDHQRPDFQGLDPRAGSSTWTWQVTQGPIPALPAPHQTHGSG